MLWAPDANPIEGWLIETPIRSATTPANLWVHWAGIAKNWGGFPPVLTDGDWHDASGYLMASVPLGDVVLRAQGAMGLAGAQREIATLFNTDDWGMAVDSVQAVNGPIVGNEGVLLPVSMRTLGRCWPTALTLTIDMLVLREALIPQTPLPYGERPKPRMRFSDRLKERDGVIASLLSLSSQKAALKTRLKALDQEIAAEPDPPSSPPPNLSPSLPRRATMGLSLSMTPPAPSPCAPPPDEKPKPEKPKRRKS